MRTKEEILQDIEEIKQRTAKLEKELKEAKKTPEFDKGKWYYGTYNNGEYEYLFRSNGNSNNKTVSYLELYYREGSNVFKSKLDFYVSKDVVRNIKLATKEQIQKILIEVAKKKGFKNGVKYECDFHGTRQKVEIDSDFRYYQYTGNSDGLTDGGGGYVYYNGKWAEIIETKSLPVLNGKEGKIENNQVVYGCQKYDISDVKKLDTCIRIFNITGSINLNGYSVTTSQIEKIVEYLNENSL